jgi:3-oxoadipate enol-lactonase
MANLKLLNTKIHFQYEHFAQEKTILLSGSLGADLSMWDKQIEHLNNDFNVLRMDIKGLGLSAVDKDALSIEEHGQDVLGLLDALELQKIYFCGISLGGLIGQWLGIHHPERFEKIILSNTAAKIGSESIWEDRIKQVAHFGLVALRNATAEKWFTPAFRENHAETVERVLDAFQRTAPEGYIANCAAVRDADFRDSLHDLKVPVLIISGLQDQVTSVSDAEYLAKEIPVNKHVSLNAAHLSSVECAEEFSKLILQFSKDQELDLH